MANKVDLWRYKEKVYLGVADEYTELSNGNIIDNGADTLDDSNFKIKYTFHCAPYRVSDRNIVGVNGMDMEDTMVIAVKHRPNFDYDSYRAKYRGKFYIITYKVPDTTAIVTYDLLSLKSVVKNGGNQASTGGYGDDDVGS
ncbi:head-tail joining protein [Lactobacillus phage SA-C12]|uniref:Head-tail joining protein n=1 Tax=Lactobacillus phage SA-C12 TaxID=1755697 RepID=A0A1I9KK53_9CAUD|nr:head-tail joining protein [Lactobacillus phage SA-C12]ALY06842.1 head-tail joining protein [Lactobacillus phage SA-C12]